jgi:glycosyltransferase involved in cell wall biosynthesis
MLSLVVPARNWPRERIEACIRSFLRLKSKALTDIVVVDFGSKSPIALNVRDKRVRVVRVEAKRWSLAEAINVGVVASRNRVIAKTDADIIVSQESGQGFDATVSALASGKAGIAIVQAIDLPPGMDAATAFRADTGTLAKEGRLRPRWGQGGLCFFTTDVWNDVGGFESRFHGWGNEDNDFADRVRRTGRRLKWVGANELRIFHVWHSPSYIAPEIVQAREANRRVYLSDRSTYRSLKFRHSKSRSLPAPFLAKPRPLVTIAIASSARPNRERMLGEAIRGFIGQIDNDFEILIADNGSTAEEQDRLNKSISRLPSVVDVRIISLAKPSIPAARNRLTDEARGRYICIADDDDIPLRDRLKDHLSAFEGQPDFHGSHGGWIDFDEITGVVDFNTGGERSLASLLYGPGKASAHPASFVRTDVLRHFRYDEDSRVGSDFDLAIRMASMGCQFAHTGSYVTLRRFHATNVTVIDHGDQRSVGITSRAKVGETLGDEYEHRLREIAKDKTSIICRNAMSADEVVALLPAYIGTWRLLVPLSDLGRQNGYGAEPHPADAAIIPNGATSREMPVGGKGRIALTGSPSALARSPGALANNQAALVRLAEQLDELVDGDVGALDCGVNPQLYFVSRCIKGAGRARQLRKLVEERLDVRADLMPDIAYERRRTKRFNWSALSRQAERLVSEPMKLDVALAALGKLPGNTALRAMTAIVSDFNCTEQLFHLVTAPIPAGEGPDRVRRLLQKQTGGAFLLASSPHVANGASR